MSERDYVEDDADNVIELDCGSRRALARPAPARDRGRGLGALPAPHRRDLRRVRDGLRDGRHAQHARALPARALRRDRRLRGRAEAADGVPGRGQRPSLGDEPDHRGPDRVPEPVRAPRAPVPRLRAHRLHRGRADHRHLEADASRAPVRAAVHRAGAPGRADRRRRSSSWSRRRASPCTSRRRTSARRCAASRSTRARSRPSGAARSTSPSCGASSCSKSAATACGSRCPTSPSSAAGAGCSAARSSRRSARAATTSSSSIASPRSPRRRA